MNKKKLLALLMALVMTFSLIPTTVWAGTDDDTTTPAETESAPAAEKPEDCPEASIEYKNAAELADLYNQLLGSDTYTEENVTALLGNLSVSDLSSDSSEQWITNMFGNGIARIGENGLEDFSQINGFNTATDGVFVFNAVDTDSETMNKYGSYLCDFVVSFDKDVAADSVILVGYYGNMVLPILLGMDFQGNYQTKQYLVSTAMTAFDYNAIVNTVGTFICAAMNISPENIGTTINVSLRMWPATGDKETDSFEVANKTFKFDDSNLFWVKNNSTGTKYYHYNSGLHEGAMTVGDDTLVSTPTPGPHFAPEGAATYVAQIGEDENATLYETLAEAIAAVPVNADTPTTITMIADETNAVGISVPSYKDFIVDFDGHTYTVNKPGAGSTGTETQAFQLLQGSTITFKNGTINVSEDNLTLATTGKNILRVFQNYANLTLENMTIDAQNQYGYYQGGKYGLSFNNGTSVIKDTTIITSGNDVVAFDVCTWDSYKNTSVTITDNSEIGGVVEVSASNVPETLSLHLESGMIGGIAMGDGADKATVTKASDFDVAAPTGYKWPDAEDGIQTLTKIKDTTVAVIGNQEYETLEAALAAISEGGCIVKTNPKSQIQVKTFKPNGEIKLLADCEGDGFVISSGSNLTIDFNEHKFTINGNPVGSDTTETIGLQLLKDSAVTFKNGTIYGDNTNTKLIRLIQNYSNLTLDKMTLSMKGKYYNQLTMSTCNGVATINDSVVNAPDFTQYGKSVAQAGADYGAAAFSVGTFNGYTVAATANIAGNSTISGNVKVEYTNENSAEGGAVLNLNGNHLTDGSIVLGANSDKVTVTKAEASTQAAPEGYKWSDAVNGIQTLTKIKDTTVAVIGNQEYDTVEAAIGAAEDGQTVELLRNASMTGTTELTMDKSITLDLKGHTLAVGRINLYKGGLNVTTSVDGGTVTCDSQAFNVYGSETNEANYTTLTIGNGVTVNSNYAVCLFPVKDTVGLSYGATINIDGTLTGSNGTLFVSGNLGNNAASGAALAGSANIPVINIGETAEITSTGDQAIAMNGMAKVNVKDGARISGREAIGVKRGILNVNGGTLTATGDKADPAQANNNGTEETGAAISVTSTYNYAGNIQVNVSGGTITSNNNAALYVGHSKNSNNKLVAFKNGVTLSVTGGNFKGDGSAVYVADAIEGEANMPANFISSGIFSAKPAAAYIATGYAAMTNDDPDTSSAYPYKVAKMKVEVEENQDATVTVNQNSNLVESDQEHQTAIEAYKTAVENATSVTTYNAVTVSGVVLTMDKTVDNTKTGVQAVVDAARTKAGDDNTAFTSSLDSAAKVEIDVDVKVTPTKYEDTVKTFELTPYATVKTYANEDQDTPSASQSGVEVTNDMIDQDQPIFVKLYTGGTAPIMLLHVGESSTETLTLGDEASLTTFKYTDDGYCEFYVSHFSEIKALFSGTNEAYISVSGGSLRRRVLTSDPDTVVKTSADLRLRFKLNNLNTGDITIKYNESYFDWGRTSSLGKKTYLTSSSNEFAALIINGVPSDNFDTEVYCQLHLVYTDGEGTHTLVSDVMHRSVSNIANAILDDNEETAKWKDYANFLLGTGDITSYKRSDYNDNGEKIV